MFSNKLIPLKQIWFNVERRLSTNQPLLLRFSNSAINCCSSRNLFDRNAASFQYSISPLQIYSLQPCKVSRRNFKRNYRFGHQRVKESAFPIAFFFLVMAVLLVAAVDFSYIRRVYPKKIKKILKKNFNIGAKTVDHGNADTETSGQNETQNVKEQEPEKEKSKEAGFRDKRIMTYENRIRSFSAPDKIFRYFATIKLVYPDGESDILMTPDDFLRCVTPGMKQPDEFGLDRFKKLDTSKTDQAGQAELIADAVRRLKKGHEENELPKDSIFYRLSSFGLISFSDFLFLLTVISVSQRHFMIAFRMFDLNGDGNVDYEEFAKVQNAILSQTTIGVKLGNAGKREYRGVSSALAKFFFGADLKNKLTIQKFLEFQQQLQQEMLTLEFNRKSPNEQGKIREVDFGQLLIAYSGFSDNKRVRMLNRVRKAFPDEGMSDSKDRGISLQDYVTFHHFLQNIRDVDIALTFYNIAGASIDEATLKHAAKTVADVDLPEHLVKVVFILFDENQDGQLSNREFISVMKERLRRGLNRPKDTGFMKFVAHMWNSMKSDWS